MSINKESFERVKECLHHGQRFVLTTHVNPDGDGLGSEVGLASYLRDLGKDVFILNVSELPDNYDFLNTDGAIKTYNGFIHRETILTADYFLILDISDWNRLRDIGKEIRKTDIPKICIDHHPQSGEFGDVQLINDQASSTGEIIYELIKYCDGKITPTIATALYTSILTDTGSFKFSNTSARVFRIAGDLVECGASSEEIYKLVYERQSTNKVKLFASILNRLRFEENGRVAWFTISKESMHSHGAKLSDTEGFADYPRVISGVEVIVMFSEADKSRTKVSLRSKGNYVVNGVARKFGGGGHQYAAGVLMEGSMHQHVKSILSEVALLLNG